MKTFWNKICSIFGVNSKVMPEVINNTEESHGLTASAVGSFLWKLVTGDTERQLVSREMAEVLADKDLRKQYNAQNVNRSITTIEIKKGNKTYKFKK